MTVNVGTLDRLARAVIGLACIALIFIGPFAEAGWPRYALGIVGAIMLLTAAIKFCPLYRVLGLRTCSTKSPGN